MPLVGVKVTGTASWSPDVTVVLSGGSCVDLKPKPRMNAPVLSVVTLVKTGLSSTSSVVKP